MCAKADLESRAEREAKSERVAKDLQKPHGFTDAAIWALPMGGDLSSLVVLLILLIPVGIALVAYAVAFIITNILSLGQVTAARKYYKKLERYSLDDPQGTRIAKSLLKIDSLFTVVILAFGIEEGIRYLLNTGPATLEIWVFRIACLVLFTTITVAFFVRLRQWLSIKSSSVYQRNLHLIEEQERGSLKKPYTK